MNIGADRDVIGFKISPTSDRVFYYCDDYDWTEYDLLQRPDRRPRQRFGAAERSAVQGSTTSTASR